MMPFASAAPALLATTCIDKQGAVITSIPPQGGHFVCQSVLKITQRDQYVIDFKNTSTIARFQHEITQDNHAPTLIKGGLSSTETNPFILRNGRVLTLDPGTYRVVTWLQSPYYLATPEIYVTDLNTYLQETHASAALSLLLLGVLLGLFVYYAAIGLIRRHFTERMFAIFIFGNLAFHAAALGVFNQFFGWYWFYLTALPLLVANLAYVSFMGNLLGINQFHRPRLYHLVLMASSLLIAVLLVGMIFPNWMLEMARYGIAIFLVIGVICGVRLSLERQAIAQLYLVATLLFVVSGGIALYADKLHLHPYTTEQLGLLAVTIEIILLSLLIAYKTSRMHFEKEQMLVELENTRSLAMTDRLTGIPNRHALESKLLQLPQHTCLIFLDVDNLKQVNDSFGHETGDHLLTLFSKILSGKLNSHGQLYRLGGDEFAILCHEDDVEWCQHQLEYTYLQMHKEGFAGVGASSGVVFAHEAEDTEELMRIGDKRMYANKRERKNRKEMMQVLHP